LDVEDHQVFFGRSGEVEQLAGLVRSPAERAEAAVLVVVGLARLPDSGQGTL
jgi:hypothetical protein